MKKLITTLIATCLITTAWATETYQTPQAFLQQTFQTQPTPNVIWLTQDIKTDIKKIMNKPWGTLRIRYWQQGPKTAWILEDIGKHKPITTGIVINNNKIETIKVLIYRENYGSEIRHPRFTRQFTQTTLDENLGLTQNIDGITGATLSTNAMKRLARLALYLTKKINETE